VDDILLWSVIAFFTASSGTLDFSELKLGAVSTEMLELNDDDGESGKTAKKICDAQVFKIFSYFILLVCICD
jgi:hypothetical protein